MINQLSKVTSWTGGGLNAPGNPAKNLPPSCGLLMKLQDTKWVQAYPEEARNVRLLAEVHRGQLWFGDRHPAQRPALLDRSTRRPPVIKPQG